MGTQMLRNDQDVLKNALKAIDKKHSTIMVADRRKFEAFVVDKDAEGQNFPLGLLIKTCISGSFNMSENTSLMKDVPGVIQTFYSMCYDSDGKRKSEATFFEICESELELHYDDGNFSSTKDDSSETSKTLERLI